MNIITKSLEYFDSKVKIKEAEQYSLNEKKNKIEFHVENTKQEYGYTEIGTYMNKNKTWTWAWAIPTKRYDEIKLVIQLLNYGLLLPPNNEENIFLKSELLTSTNELQNIQSLDKYISMSCYLTKRTNIFIAYNYYSNEKTIANKKVDEVNLKNDFTFTLLILDD